MIDARRGERGHWLTYVGIGCLTIVVLIAAAGYYAYTQIPKMAAAGIELMTEAMLEQMKIPEAEKKEVMEAVKELTDKVRSGEIGMEDGAAIAEQFAKGPIMAVVIARTFDAKFVEGSELTDAEKEDARKQVSRYVTGVTEKKIDKSTTEEITNLITVKTTGADGKTKQTLRDKLTTDELKEVVVIMTKAAEKAGIADKKFEYSIADEVRKAIKKVMDKKASAK